MHTRLGALFGALLLSLSGAASAQVVTPVAPHAPAKAAAAPTTPAGPVGHALTAEDVGAWVDGLIPDAISRADIAGAVVVVVKDGQVLFERGYGLADVKGRRPVDAETTLFRPGSVSKLFTWTAVMQQVEAGKIDLDADVNRYLDFKIPPYKGQPITMRQIMSHSAGFSDVAKDLIGADPKHAKNLEQYLKAQIPARIFPPGQVPAYSNYGASIAGYVVQRASGEPFEQYVAKHIFAPLGMTHSTFEQPLPAGWSAHMAQGFEVASEGKPRPFEIVQAGPAGALSASGGDMARFMIAHLQDGEYQGQRILGAETAQLMHKAQFEPVPGIGAMALGFYTEPGNGHRVIGHAGDTNFFHSDLHLYLDDHVGLFVSFSSAGAQGAAHNIRTSLFRGFTDRYFPVSRPDEPTWKTANADGKTLSGLYINSRRPEMGWLRVLTFLLGQDKISADKDGIVTVSSFRGPANKPKHWREVGPFQYREVGGDSRMAALVKDGKVVRVMTDDLPPVMSLEPVSPAMSATWNKPLFYAAMATLLTAAVTWPLAAIIRRRYGHKFTLTGRQAMLYRLTRAACVLNLVVVGLWFYYLNMVQKDLSAATSASDGLLRTLQVVGLVAVLGALPALANAGDILRDGSRSWWAKVSSSLIALACVACVWFQFSLHLITIHTAY